MSTSCVKNPPRLDDSTERCVQHEKPLGPSREMTKGSTFNDHFSGFADKYAAGRPTYPDALYQFVADHAPSRRRVWDCATGNGQAAVRLSNFFEAVYATDASRQQIDNAVVAANVTYTVQPAEETDFPDDYFDAVTIAQALHWFELDRFSIELARVLKPNGLIVAWTYGFFRVSPEIDAVFDAEIHQPIEDLWRAGNHMAKSGYANLRLPFHRIELPRFEMNCRWNLEELVNYFSTWSALNRYTEQHGSEIIQHAAEQLGKVWGDSSQKRIVAMDFHVLGWQGHEGI